MDSILRDDDSFDPFTADDDRLAEFRGQLDKATAERYAARLAAVLREDPVTEADLEAGW